MAITSAQLQTALGTNPMNARVIQAFEPSQSTQQQWYVIGNADAPGRARWINTTAASNAATQATDVLAQLRA